MDKLSEYNQGKRQSVGDSVQLTFIMIKEFKSTVWNGENKWQNWESGKPTPNWRQSNNWLENKNQ